MLRGVVWVRCTWQFTKKSWGTRRFALRTFFRSVPLNAHFSQPHDVDITPNATPSRGARLKGPVEAAGKMCLSLYVPYNQL